MDESRGICCLRCRKLLRIYTAFRVCAIALVELSLVLVVWKCCLRGKGRRILLLFYPPLASWIFIDSFKVRNRTCIIVFILFFLIIEVVPWILVAVISLSVVINYMAWSDVELTFGLLVPSVTKVFSLVLRYILTIKRLSSSIIPAGTANRVNLIKVTEPRPVLFSRLLFKSTKVLITSSLSFLLIVRIKIVWLFITNLGFL